ncbi:hypothetical protein A3C23_04410 [Candidatus Roizmanbacteria bacterium RIFCSPHIGHO2_02_FULL_37_13b]|uniref:Glycosyltransferase 2-like domain-containing protein n=1 Tax=Candidatus Roizmanbacteria bacterium RIFCSPLOWO2_02_FULL_36_11 TaxID=1802071 RepID=A0A1F7JH86_9BACT|nr:MAG: hypothetical protein A3C23_04410 [Candidatus Roizmanbacteria bacterium RIFCSPHIGHO2_02_FULL_37_13b]OGK54952.1 MAG: hypothetical protein A3H78_00555 [Candidatus Roizmanbacteria bacterium RIFCSPLOWO2_02_FULL_36_11]
MPNSDSLISIVIPVFNEEANIKPLLDKLLPIVKDLRSEIIFVNDGSKDNTASEIKKYAKKDQKIKLISFLRNFGHQMALSAGYLQAAGDCVISMDADLQDPPELITKMIDQWQKGFKIVYAKREKRDESFFKKITASIFYRLINSLSDTPIPTDVGDFRLLDKDVVELLNKFPERSRFLRGLVAWGGFSSNEVTFERKKRIHGITHYPLSKMINFALDGIVSFSTKPLKIATYLGFFTSFFGLLGMLYAIYRRFFLPHDYWVTGWTALFVAIVFFGGVQLLTIGIIGEYIGKIYKEIQSRPQYLIKEKVNL